MIYYPIECLVKAGIDDILLVAGGNHAGEFLRLLGNGKEFGLMHLNYTYQEGENGIADALGLAEFFVGGESLCVVLADNIIEKSIIDPLKSYEEKQKARGAKILIKEVPDPQRFGVPELKGDKILCIEEKPKYPKSSYAVTGIYLYDNRVFDIIRSLKPSGRGELEITDVNNAYIEMGEMTYDILEGWWTDAGTFDSLLKANNLVAKTGANNLT